MPLTTVGKMAQTRFLENSSEKQDIDPIWLLAYPYLWKMLRRVLNWWTDIKEQICQTTDGAVEVALADLGTDLIKMDVSCWTNTDKCLCTQDYCAYV